MAGLEERRLKVGEGRGEGIGRRFGDGGANMPCDESDRRPRGRREPNESKEKIPNSDLKSDPCGCAAGGRVAEVVGVLGTPLTPILLSVSTFADSTDRTCTDLDLWAARGH